MVSMPYQLVSERLGTATTRSLKALDQFTNFERLQDILRSMEGPIYRASSQLDYIKDRLNGLCPPLTDDSVAIDASQILRENAF